MPSPFLKEEIDIIVEMEKRFVVSRGQRWCGEEVGAATKQLPKEHSGDGGVKHVDCSAGSMKLHV